MIMFIGLVLAVVLVVVGLVLAANDWEGLALLCFGLAMALLSFQCIVWVNRFWFSLKDLAWLKTTVLAIGVIIALTSACILITGTIGWGVSTLFPVFAHSLCDGPGGLVITGLSLYVSVGTLLLIVLLFGAAITCFLYMVIAAPFVRWIRQNWFKARDTVRNRHGVS